MKQKQDFCTAMIFFLSMFPTYNLKTREDAIFSYGPGDMDMKQKQLIQYLEHLGLVKQNSFGTKENLAVIMQWQGSLVCRKTYGRSLRTADFVLAKQALGNGQDLPERIQEVYDFVTGKE